MVLQVELGLGDWCLAESCKMARPLIAQTCKREALGSCGYPFENEDPFGNVLELPLFQKFRFQDFLALVMCFSWDELSTIGSPSYTSAVAQPWQSAYVRCLFLFIILLIPLLISYSFWKGSMNPKL